VVDVRNDRDVAEVLDHEPVSQGRKMAADCTSGGTSPLK
jgi:hypothetical protein